MSRLKLLGFLSIIMALWFACSPKPTKNDKYGTPKFLPSDGAGPTSDDGGIKETSQHSDKKHAHPEKKKNAKDTSPPEKVQTPEKLRRPDAGSIDTNLPDQALPDQALPDQNQWESPQGFEPNNAFEGNQGGRERRNNRERHQTFERPAGGPDNVYPPDKALPTPGVAKVTGSVKQQRFKNPTYSIFINDQGHTSVIISDFKDICALSSGRIQPPRKKSFSILFIDTKLTPGTYSNRTGKVQYDHFNPQVSASSQRSTIIITASNPQRGGYVKGSFQAIFRQGSFKGNFNAQYCPPASVNQEFSAPDGGLPESGFPDFPLPEGGFPDFPLPEGGFPELPPMPDGGMPMPDFSMPDFPIPEGGFPMPDGGMPMPDIKFP